MKSAFLMITIIALGGCATIVNDPNIPLAFSFSDGSTGQCNFKNKRGAWPSEIPTTNLLIRRSDDNLVYDCTTKDGRTATGSIRSEIEGDKLGASVIFWDFGITDSITDKHRTYQGNVVIPLPASGASAINIDKTEASHLTALDFYGQAEEEVNLGNYDKNIWAKALVDVEGDETKRKAKYIELRATQLYSEKIGSISDSNKHEQPALSVDVTGTYTSTIKGNIGAKNIVGRNPEVKLIQKGKKVSGTYGSTRGTIWGEIWGEIEDGSIKFKYEISWGGFGSGEWTVEPDSREIIGKWEDRYGGGGKWNLTRIK